ncbi:MAG TPA: M50 family metallopeptidase [Thermoanaerobaculia bacterium]|nr:M50 family metallopeptidase [Thermoanaerobaculia bacterium]
MGRIHLGSILGTTIDLDFSFLILLAFWVMSDVGGAGGMKYALLWIPVIVISVLFHELAHAAVIGAFGFGPSRIMLQGIGGVTMNERRARPWQDLLISAAGPCSSFLLAFLLRIVIVSFPRMSQDPFFAALLPLLAEANILWGFFNLLPVAPLDGYAMVRHFLRLFASERTSFLISIWLSMIVGALLTIVSMFLRQPFIALLMAWFVWSSYQQWQFFRSYNRPED